MEPQQSQDHDLLIELRTEMRGLRTDFKAMADDTKERITRLEEKKLDKDDFQEFLTDYKLDRDKKQKSIDFLMKWFWIAWGAVVLLQILIGYYLSFHH